jgi:hypothetical protein
MGEPNVIRKDAARTSANPNDGTFARRVLHLDEFEIAPVATKSGCAPRNESRGQISNDVATAQSDANPVRRAELIVNTSRVRRAQLIVKNEFWNEGNWFSQSSNNLGDIKVF